MTAGMTDRETHFRTGVDRMDHPLSHTAAVVAGVAFIVVAGCGALLLSDLAMLRSSTWWSALVLAGSVLSVSLIGYFRPHSRAVYVPVILAGVVTLGLCVWHAWWVRQPDSVVRPAKGLYQSLVFFGAWLAWAGGKFRHLRHRRQRAG